MVAATLTPGESTAEMVLGYAGLITALCVIVSPAHTFVAIWKTKKVGTTKPYSYLAVVLNSAIWVVFGVPALKNLLHHGHHSLIDQLGLPLMIANAAGVIVESGYVLVYLRFAGAGNRWLPLVSLTTALAVPAVLLGLLLGMEWSRTFVGFFAMFSGVAMYGIPVITTYTAYKNNDLTQISRLQAAASLLNGAVWTAYSCIGRVRAFIFVPNVVAVICATVQLIVWCVIKYRAPPRDPEAGRRDRGPRVYDDDQKVDGDVVDAERARASVPRAGGNGHVEMSDAPQDPVADAPQDVQVEAQQGAQVVDGAGAHENNPDEEVQVAAKNEALVPEAVAPGGGGLDDDDDDEVENQAKEQEGGSGHSSNDDDEVENQAKEQEGGGGHSSNDDGGSYDGDGGGGSIPVEEPGEDKAEEAIPE